MEGVDVENGKQNYECRNFDNCHCSFGSVDSVSLSPTNFDETKLAIQREYEVSDLGTRSRMDERRTLAGEMASIVHAWPHLPDNLRAAILLMVQPWVKTGIDIPLADAHGHESTRADQ